MIYYLEKGSKTPTNIRPRKGHYDVLFLLINEIDYRIFTLKCKFLLDMDGIIGSFNSYQEAIDNVCPLCKWIKEN